MNWLIKTLPFRCMQALLPLALFGVLTGCGSLPLGTARDYQAHYLLIHKDGIAIKVPDAAQPLPNPSDDLDTNQTLTTPELRQQIELTIRAGLDAHVERIQAHQVASCREVLQLLVIVHGGMNGYEHSAAHMTELLNPPLSQPPGAAPPAQPESRALLNETCYYPLFINWDSDFGDSWADDLFRYRFGVRNPVFASLTSPIQAAGRVISSAAHVPSSLFHQGFTIAEGIRGGAEQGDPASGLALDTLANTPGIALSTAFLPFTQGFGAPSWSIMKRRVDEAVAGRLSPDDTSKSGAARTLAQALKNWVTKKNGQWVWRDSVVPVQVTIVGHSMGAMIINRLLEETEQAPLLESTHAAPQASGGSAAPSTPAGPTSPVTRIVYLAPACSIDEAEHLLMPYLERHQDTEFWLFNLNRRDESREIPGKGWALFVPRGTLLTWIDTFLEDEYAPGEGRLGWVRSLGEYYGINPEPSVKRSFSDYFAPNNTVPLTQNSSQALPRPHARTLWRDLRVNWTVTDKPERLHAYETTRRVRQHGHHPEVHSDFMKAQYFRQVLCQVDSTAFPSPSACQTP